MSNDDNDDDDTKPQAEESGNNIVSVITGTSPLWFYIFMILCVINLILVFSALLYGTFADIVMWMIFFIGAILVGFGMWACYMGSIVGTYILTIIGNIFLLISIIYTQSHGSYTGRWMYISGVYFMEIIMFVLTMLCAYKISGGSVAMMALKIKSEKI